MNWIQIAGILVLAYLVLKIFVYGVLFRHEVKATLERDPAATGPVSVIFSYPGLHALLYYRVANVFYKMKLPFFARVISQMSRFLTGIEIHPGATIGKGLFIDHGTGVVIGETAVIGDNVTIFQGVTLGGTGKQRGKRHPTLGSNVVVGAGAKILGDITVGDNAAVGANAVVLKNVPANCTVVGVPGRIARREGKKVSGNNLDYTNLPDPLTQALEKLQREITKIEHELDDYGSEGEKGKPKHS